MYIGLSLLYTVIDVPEIQPDVAANDLKNATRRDITTTWRRERRKHSNLLSNVHSNLALGKKMLCGILGRFASMRKRAYFVLLVHLRSLGRWHVHEIRIQIE